MVIGYIRVSKTDQNQDLQFDSLKKAGCEKIYHEKISGASMQRPEYIRMISELRKGDVVNFIDKLHIYFNIKLPNP